MCHERLSRRLEQAEEARGRRLWDLFHRETQHPAPTVPIAEREAEIEPDSEEILSGATHPTTD